MSAEVDAAVAATRAFFDSAGQGLVWELAAKRSEGASFGRRRDEPPQSRLWLEEALAVRVSFPDGRSGLSSAAGWGSATEAATAAVADARRQVLPCLPGADFAEAWELAPPDVAPAVPPPSPSDLSEWLDAVLEAAAAVDARTRYLELGRARAAHVTTRLVNSRGLDLEVLQDLAQLEAELVGREISKHAGSFDAMAGARLDASDARELGERLGRAIRRQLDGVPRAPGEGRVLLTREVVGEISFRLAPALLGLDGDRSSEDSPRVSAGLQLSEDAADDGEARSVPADGVGFRLQRLELIRAERLVGVEPSRLPLVRPGIADPPRPGWLRLSWSAEDGRSDEELVTELGSGLLVERAVTESFDARELSWRGQVEGWWVEDGVGKRPVARLPVQIDLKALLPRILAAGRVPRSAHGSGTVRAVPWLLESLPRPD